MTRKIDFNVSARTARLIGLENFANAEGAIVELVKNAYDADSNRCIIVFDKDVDSNESCLYIIDDGQGMTSQTIIDHWMTIGTDDKLINVSSKKDRVKSGAKGIGRFALNRLGRKTNMWTFTEDNKSMGCMWSIDWDKLENVKVLSEFKAELSDIHYADWIGKFHDFGLDKIPSLKHLFTNEYHGTILQISSLNDNWTLQELNSLKNNLEMLIPEYMESIFEIDLYSLQDIEWGGKITPTIYEEYDYKIVANYQQGRTIDVTIIRNELNISLLETKYNDVFKRKAMLNFPYRLEDIRNKEVTRQLHINSTIDNDSLEKVGAFDFTFYFVKNSTLEDRESDGAKKYPYNGVDAAVRRNWLGKFGGVRIYRDQFRVRPYGENGNDWLGLGKRQAQSPGGVGQKMGGYRIRPNQIAGIVSISRLTNAAFEDKSSREGIQENTIFTLFKNLLLMIIGSFEEDRNTIMYNLSELYKEKFPTTQEADKIAQETIKENSKSSTKKIENNTIVKLAEGYQTLKNELQDRDAEIAMLRGLASIGISVATYTHELHSVMERLLPRTEMIKKTMRKYISAETLVGVSKFDDPYYALDLMHSEDEKLYNWLRYSLNSIQRSKRERKAIDIVNYLADFVKAWESALEKRNISIELLPHNIKSAIIEGLEIDLDSIFNNFVANSIASLITTDEPCKAIKIFMKADHDIIVIDFLDNGNGLAEEYRENPDVIFNAFETSVVNQNGEKIGTGMGLFIVQGIISKYPDADVSVLKIEKGFGIRVVFKIKK